MVHRQHCLYGYIDFCEKVVILAIVWFDSTNEFSIIIDISSLNS